MSLQCCEQSLGADRVEKMDNGVVFFRVLLLKGKSFGTKDNPWITANQLSSLRQVRLVDKDKCTINLKPYEIKIVHSFYNCTLKEKITVTTNLCLKFCSGKWKSIVVIGLLYI